MKIRSCGIATTLVMMPRLHAKIIAVKKSRTDFDIRIVTFPVIPASRLPYIPVPLEQNKTTAVTNSETSK